MRGDDRGDRSWPAPARQLTLQQELAGVTVGQVMTRDIATARAGATLAQAIDEAFLAHDARAGAVERDGRFVGLVTLGDLACVPRGRWAEMPVEAVMTPLARLVAVAPADQVLAALERIQGGGFNQLPVVADGHIVGLLTRHDLLRFVRRRAALHPPQTTADGGGPARAMEPARQPL
jgi:CBS domain-containing protein